MLHHPLENIPGGEHLDEEAHGAGGVSGGRLGPEQQGSVRGRSPGPDSEED